MKRYLACFLLIPLVHSAEAQLRSPADFLGYELGERFTPHHRVTDYVRHVADIRHQRGSH